MMASNTSETELAKITNIPQSTINRILLEGTSNPTVSTILPIAKFFKVSIEELVSEQKLGNEKVLVSTSVYKNISILPIISYEQIIDWVDGQIVKVNYYDEGSFVVSEKKLSDKSYAIRSKPSMEPRFKENSLFLIDNDVFITDNCFVVVSISGATPTLRKAIIDGNTTYFQHLDTTIPSIVIGPHVRILGVLVESRFPYYDRSI